MNLLKRVKELERKQRPPDPQAQRVIYWPALFADLRDDLAAGLIKQVATCYGDGKHAYYSLHVRYDLVDSYLITYTRFLHGMDYIAAMAKESGWVTADEPFPGRSPMYHAQHKPHTLEELAAWLDVMLNEVEWVDEEP